MPKTEKRKMHTAAGSRTHSLGRREFLLMGTGLLAGAGARSATASKSIVSIVRIENDKVGVAVEKAIDLLGGIRQVTKGINTVMLKPNLVSTQVEATTKPVVVRTLAEMMQRAGKEVSIGEGSAAAPKFNVVGSEVFRTRKREILDPMQQYVFEQLGYAEMAKALRIPLVNLHSGDLVDVVVPEGFVFDKITLHRSLTQIDLLCSVPMMKTHQLATVTLGMKNLVGAFPGTVYQSVRGHMHDLASKAEPTAASAVVVDMVRANKLGLVVVDGSMAMEGNGPSSGQTFKMNVIVAGTNPLATDMVAANLMGFEPNEIPTFMWANKAGMKPSSVDEIEIRGESLDRLRRPFAKPQLYAWNAIRSVWGAKEI
jgi:uncharacterized protein (DUF362 family)